MRAQLVFSTALLLGAATAGCFDILNDSNVFPDGTGGTSGTGGTGATGGTGGTTTTSSVPVECIPSGTSSAVDSSCGIFVSPNGSDDTGDGSQDKPYATITKALTAGDSIYVCAGMAAPSEEAVLIGVAGVYLFGGLDCETWIYNAATKTSLTAKPGEVPLKVVGGGTLRIEDFAITARDAPALMATDYVAGKSSIGVVVEAGASLDMARCDVTAGKGGDGAPGEPPTGMGMAGPGGSQGTDGCVGISNNAGVDGGQNTCGLTNASGGLSGTGTKTSSGGNGSDGEPTGGPLGEAGLGQTNVITCDQGGQGENGVPGDLGAPGKGASADMTGTLSAEGIVGPNGASGMTGVPGQGGGGGGGARICADMTNAGPSGGGGGAGGCGGAGGKGGHAGGASIGILSLGANLLFENVKITTAAGGKGGGGATGQDGGTGGMGGMPGAGDANAIACKGGNGGAGGKGGRGGGGLGGHSVGIAHTGNAPAIEGASITAGAPGEGGLGEGADGNGAAGLAMPVQAF